VFTRDETFHEERLGPGHALSDAPAFEAHATRILRCLDLDDAGINDREPFPHILDSRDTMGIFRIKRE